MAAVRNLQKIQQDNKSMICLGLDLDPRRIPSEYAGSMKGMFDFGRRIIDATSDLVCAYKPNLAFYESLGTDGWSLLKLLRERIPDDVPVILDGKRGDIGNTASHYARSLFEDLNADWVTLNPYMGYDSMRPFLEHKDKGVFVLCLTSNSGSRDFQQLLIDGKPLYRIVAEKVAYWDKDNNCGLVVGATHPDQLRELRAVAGDMPLLIPGVGAQGGSLEQAALNGTDTFRKPAVINVSRSVLYASSDEDFAQRARQELQKLNAIIEALRTGSTSGVAEDEQAPEDTSSVQESSVSVVVPNSKTVHEPADEQPHDNGHDLPSQENHQPRTNHDTPGASRSSTDNAPKQPSNDRDHDKQAHPENASQIQSEGDTTMPSSHDPHTEQSPSRRPGPEERKSGEDRYGHDDRNRHYHG